MPRPRFHKLTAEKQQRILDAAIGEFADKGYYKASYNQIIEKAGISKGAMYYYFDDKTDLYVTALELVMGLQELSDLSFESASPADFWAQLRGLCDMMLTATAERPELIGFARSYVGLEPGELGHRLDGLMETSSQMINGVLLQGQQVGAVRDDLALDLMTPIIFRLGETIDRWWIEREMDLSNPDVRTSIVDIYMDLMGRFLAPTNTENP